MKAVILLAGQSKRFWPLTEKTLFPICGKTLLEHQVHRLASAGITDLLFVGGKHNLEEVQTLYPDKQVVEQEDLSQGMLGAMLSCLPHCGNEPFLLVSGNDVIEPLAYRDLLQTAETCDGALLAQEVETYFPGGYLELDGDKITSIVEKPGEGNEPSNLVNIVAHVHNDPQALLAELQQLDNSSDDGYEQALQKLFDTKTYKATPYTGTWQAVKFPWHLLHLLPILLEDITEQSIHESVTVHETAVITGPVVIEEGTKVMPHATIVGPCYIGKNCIVANNALVRGSSIGDHSVVGYNTEAKGSIWHSHVWTHMSYSGDSVVGSNVSFGAGSMTGNLRLDEGDISSAHGENALSTGLSKCGAIIGNDCRLGIQTGTNPGVKIGSGTFVSSGVLVANDVPDAQFVRMKDGVVKMSDNHTEVPQPEDREKYRKKV